MILFFSACGNSRFVASRLAELTGQRLMQINPLDASPSLSLAPQEPLGVVCPVYAWNTPRIVNNYIKRLRVSGSPSYLFLALTCGDTVGRAPERFAKLLHSKGMSLNAAFSFVMPETYINLPGFNLDTPEGARSKIEAVKMRLPLVAEKINGRVGEVDVVRGKWPWLNSYLVNPLFYALLITDRKFTVSDACTSCALCQKLCPLQNISIVNGRPRWNGHCTNCMACYHHCPVNAIHFGKATQRKGQYFFQDAR